jgi:hypothetical protein
MIGSPAARGAVMSARWERRGCLGVASASGPISVAAAANTIKAALHKWRMAKVNLADVDRFAIPFLIAKPASVSTSRRQAFSQPKKMSQNGQREFARPAVLRCEQVTLAGKDVGCPVAPSSFACQKGHCVRISAVKSGSRRLEW